MQETRFEHSAKKIGLEMDTIAITLRKRYPTITPISLKLCQVIVNNPNFTTEEVKDSLPSSPLGHSFTNALYRTAATFNLNITYGTAIKVLRLHLNLIFPPSNIGAAKARQDVRTALQRLGIPALTYNSQTE